MSASFYDLLKFAKTGTASPSMTAYDKMKALAMCKAGFPVKTLTGVPPLTFKSDGTPLISWSMLGNGSQTGTPTPDNPVMPEFVGVRTANIAYKRLSGCNINGVGVIIENDPSTSTFICAEASGSKAGIILQTRTYSSLKKNEYQIRDMTNVYNGTENTNRSEFNKHVNWQTYQRKP